ncbi:MAG: DUF1761 domain-containing protein [Flammeovirgaceae bacterium]|nr:DUF1761 domain-containing protein [Flammeovirgaceae bacterium]
MNKVKFNHLAILVCFILLTGLGLAWYGYLFMEPWMELVGLDMATAEANPPTAGVWITNTIATIVPLYALAWIFGKMNVNSGMQGAAIGFVITISFHHLSVMTGNMFAMIPYALTWITGGFDLVAMTLSGFILGAWRKK